jgi:pyruvyltransferase
MEFFNKASYGLSKDLIFDDNKIPLTWWTVTPNFGDLLSPYLVEKLTSTSVKLIKNRPGSKRKLRLMTFRKPPFSYLGIGSIISRANANSIVWGSGAFGTETQDNLSEKAKYLAVRGPLTRNLLRMHGIQCPEVYGDPALLLPGVFNPPVKKRYKIGVILRWSETDWHHVASENDVKKINLGTSDIEGTLTDILSCEKIVSSSLHGIILADAYGIPSAWLSSSTPKGLEFKFYDYFISVNKIQKPQFFDFSLQQLTYNELEEKLKFDSREIEFDTKKLLDACPFIQQINS